MRRGAAAVVALGLGAMGLVACGSPGEPSSTPTGTQHRTLVVNDEPTDVCLAMAYTVGQQVAGLAGRASLPPREGMAFPFSDTNVQTFNMKNTNFALQIVWVGPNDQYLGSETMTPNSASLYTSPAPVTLAIELAPQDWGPVAGKARTVSLGTACDGRLTAGPPGKQPSRF